MISVNDGVQRNHEEDLQSIFNAEEAKRHLNISARLKHHSRMLKSED